jgi:hypothetical protein
MVRPTLAFSCRRFIRRYTDALVPPVISVRHGISFIQTLIIPPPRPPPVRRLACHFRQPLRTSASPRSSAVPPHPPPAARAAPPCLSYANASPRPAARVSAAGRIPAKRRRGGLLASISGCARIFSDSTATRCSTYPVVVRNWVSPIFLRHCYTFRGPFCSI